MASRTVFGPHLLTIATAVVCIAAPAEAAETATVERAAPLLSSPRSSGRTLAELPSGSKVRILERKGDWILVIARGEKGWVSADALTKPPEGLDEGTEVTTNDATTLRAKPDARGKALFDVQAGERFHVVEDKGEWVSVVDETETSGWLPRSVLDAARKKPTRKPATTTERAKDEKRTWAKQGLMEGEGSDAARTQDGAPAPQPRTDKVSLKKVPPTGKAAAKPAEDDVDMAFDVEEPAPSKSAKKSTGSAESDAAGDDEDPLAEKRRAASATVDHDAQSDGDGDGDDEPEVAQRRTQPGRSRFVWGFGAQLGMVAQSSSFSSEGTSFRSNYALSNGAGVISVRATGATRVGAWNFGADVSGYMSFAGGDMAHRDAAEDTMDESIAFSQKGVGGTLTVDYAPRKSWYVGGVMGAHRVRRSVTVDDNLALPSEAQSGFHLGARAGYVAPAAKWSVETSGATVLGGSLVQREGLRDGTSSDVSGMRLGATATMRITPRLQGEVGYQLVTSSIDFSGASQRDPENAAGAHRSDKTQLLGVGARFAF